MSATLREPRKAAARTALGYAAVAALWILLSDEIANRLFPDPATLQVVSMTKGWVFVAVTAVLLYFRIEEQIRRWSDEVDRRVQIEAQLRRITRAVDQGPASVVVTDRQGVIEYVNEKFTRVTGYTREESVGQHVRMLKSGQTDPAVYRQMWQAILAGGEWRGELLNRKKNGELFWESASMSPVVDDDGQTYSFLAVKEDITERRALEQQLRQSQKLEAIGTLAGGVAHDFNNLLSVILGSATLLRRPAQSHAEQAELAEEIVQAAERGAALTRQLLIFSRKNAMRREPVEVNALVTNLSVMIGRVLRSNIVLETRCQSRPSFVMADGGLVEQVLLNLAVNARDAMPDGGRLTIATDRTLVSADGPAAPAGTAPGAYVTIVVTDTGTGIPVDVAPHIFEPFYTTKDSGKGTGLGLSTAYGIVQQHGGWIGLDTRMGEGTTFTVALPLIDPVSRSSPS